MRATRGTRLAMAMSVLAVLASPACGFDGLGGGTPEVTTLPSRPDASTDAPLDTNDISISDAADETAPDSGGMATVGDFCSKCAECVTANAGFSDDFCDPYKTGTTAGFDTARCTANATRPKTVTLAQLRSWTCQQFDDAL